MKPLVVRILGNDGSFLVSLLHYLCLLWGWREGVSVNVEHSVLLDPTETLREALERFATALHKATNHPTPPPVVTYRSACIHAEESDINAVFDSRDDGEIFSLHRENFHRIGPVGRLAMLSKVYAVVSGTLDEARARRDGDLPRPSPPPPKPLQYAESKEVAEIDDPDLLAVHGAVLPALADTATLQDGMNRAFATCFPSGCRDEWERWLWGCLVQGILGRIPELPEVMAFGNEKEQGNG